MAQITVKSDEHSVYDFRYNHGGEYPAAWVRWKQKGAESSKAFDHDRTVLVVTALEGGKNQIVDFLGLTAPDLENWAEYADCELRREHHLPERGQEWDTNALRDPAPLSVEFAEGLRCFSVTISTQEYETLKKDSALLNALDACGVDNWHGYSDARRYLREQQEEDEE